MKIVNKPWGKEIWIAYPPEFPYVMKKIFTNTGHRSSVHFHMMKKESNYVISGKANVYTCNTAGNNLTTEELLKSMDKKVVKAGDVFHIQPGVAHRIEAIEGMVTIEVSTPQVDDVIRLQDDTGRGNGRIESEHK